MNITTAERELISKALTRHAENLTSRARELEISLERPVHIASDAELVIRFRAEAHAAYELRARVESERAALCCGGYEPHTQGAVTGDELEAGNYAAARAAFLVNNPGATDADADAYAAEITNMGDVTA